MGIKMGKLFYPLLPAEDPIYDFFRQTTIFSLQYNDMICVQCVP